MRVVIEDSYTKTAEFTAEYIFRRIKDFAPSPERPFVLGLPTGSTPIGVYDELIKKYKAGQISFKNVVTFNMDEYVGLDKSHRQSYYYFMMEHFFKHVDIDLQNVHFLSGVADDLKAECADYEKQIKAAGGINLFFGGVGVDGHIAFNEPSTSFLSRTGLRHLAENTIQMNSRFFADISQVPTSALSVGVGTIMDADEVVIMATGFSKAEAVQKAVEGGVNHLWTITALQNHGRAVLVCDAEATDELKVKTVRYFRAAEKNRQEDEYGRYE